MLQHGYLPRFHEHFRMCWYKLVVQIFNLADLPDILIGMKTQRINIAPYTASEKGWLLRNDAELHPQVLQSNGANVKIINEYSPTAWIDKAEQCTQKSRLPTPGSANNTYLVPCFKCASDTSQDRRRIWPVLDL